MRVALGADGVRTVRVKSSDGVTTYLVKLLPGGLWTCTCDGSAIWGKVCRHIKAVRSRLTEDTPATGEQL